jgi:ABC-type Fe3+-hydroxamate transport system substrate-binding protein
MTAVNRTRGGDADVYEATEVIDGGLLVVPAAGATNPGVQGIAKAGATALNVLGVTARRAEPVANQALTATDGDGYPVTYPNPVNELTTVYKACVTDVTYTAVAVGHGVKLKAAANGQVQAWVSGTDSPAAIIGECRVVGGMSGAGGVGKAYIY